MRDFLSFNKGLLLVAAAIIALVIAGTGCSVFTPQPRIICVGSPCGANTYDPTLEPTRAEREAGLAAAQARTDAAQLRRAVRSYNRSHR